MGIKINGFGETFYPVCYTIGMQKNKNTLFCSKSVPVFPKYDTRSKAALTLAHQLLRPLSKHNFTSSPRSSLARTQIVVTPNCYLHQHDTCTMLCHHKAQFVHGCSTVENNIKNRQAPLAVGYVHVALQGSCQTEVHLLLQHCGGAKGPCLRTACSARTHQANWTLQVKHAWPQYRLLSVRAPLVYKLRRYQAFECGENKTKCILGMDKFSVHTTQKNKYKNSLPF